MPAPPLHRTQHYQNLDAVRGIAAQVVVVVHVILLIASNDPVYNAITGWPGRLSVLVFFCLSGFAIATSIERGFTRSGGFDGIDYAIRRFARIYPPYLVAVLAAAAIAIAAHDGVRFAALDFKLTAMPLGASTLSWLRALTFTYLQRPNEALLATNIAIWSLRLEIILYAVAGFAALAIAASARLRRVLWTTLGAVCLLVLIGAFTLGATATVLFACGGAAALLRNRLRPSLWATFAGFICIALLPLFVPVLSRDGAVGLAYQACIGLPIGIWMIALAQAPPAPGWFGKALIHTGSWSYTLYVLHPPTLVALRAILDVADLGYGGSLARQIVTLCGSFLIANLVAYCVARVVERPAQFAAWIEQILFRRSGSRRAPA